MNERHWAIRPYIEGDETSYIAFMNSVFPRVKFDLKRWDWEYRDNPFGFIQIFGDSGGRIVGHMGLACVKIKVGECIVRGSQAVDLAVCPDYRGRGMFLEIGEKLMQDAQDEGVVISYGVPNEPAYRGHLKYGWFYVSEISVLVKVMSKRGFLIFLMEKFTSFISRPHSEFISKLIGLIKSSIKTSHVKDWKNFPRAGDFKIHVVTSFDEQIDKFWEVTSEQYHLLVARTSEYLNWRYVMKPHSDYVIQIVKRQDKIEGYVVLSTETHGSLGGKRGYIVDIFAGSEKAIHCLLQSAFNYFVGENVDLVTCWMVRNQLSFDCFSKGGFINDSSASQKLICRINTSDDEFTKLYRRVEKEWFFTMGDSDAI
ncbi:GNAT family N-acetyltransferase [Candidatus Bathyarchaeota archaeon]|nr:GNAT family N-acetyltransferase [Candidatus Bathyarchaeota archaeon]